MKDFLLKDLNKILDQTKDYNRFSDLFGDKSKSVMTRLRKTIMSIKNMVQMAECKDVIHPTTLPLDQKNVGKFVRIRPCGEEYGNKTYLGILIGDVATGTGIQEKDNKIQLEFCNYNPAIFVPSLKKIIYGFQSWWSEIEDEKELKEITDSDIDNIWYVKCLKELNLMRSK